MKSMLSIFVLLFSFSSFACDIESLKNILKESVAPTIHCLGKGIKDVVDRVQPDGSGETTIAAIEEYIQQNGSYIEPKFFNALKAVSDLNHLISGDAKGALNLKSVEGTLNFLIVLNREYALNITPIMESEQETSYALHRVHKSRVRDASNKIGAALMQRLSESGEVRQVNIKEVLANLTNEDLDLKNLLS